MVLAPLLKGLLGNVLFDVLALLPGHGVAHLSVDVAALLLVLELGHRGRAGGALLLGHLVTNLTGIRDVLANLLGNLVADPAVDSLALPLGHLLGVDLGHEAAVPPGLLLAVPDGNLLAGLAVQLLAVNLGHLDTLVLGLVLALLTGEGMALTLSVLLAVSLGHILALLLLHSLTLPLIDITTLLLGNTAALTGEGMALT